RPEPTAAPQGCPGAEAPGNGLPAGGGAGAPLPGGGPQAGRQPEHALRPVDPRPQVAPRARRPGRAGPRDDRDAGDPALDALAGAPGLAHAADHVDPPPGYLPLPLRRPRA